MSNPKMIIDLSEEDLQELQSGETFDWSFPTDDGQTIDIHLYNSSLEEEQDE